MLKSNNQGSAQELLKIYNEIDEFLRRQPGSDREAEHSYLIQQVARTNRVVARFESELRAIAKLRNSIVHNPMEEIASPLVYPNPKLIDHYQAIRDSLIKPKGALAIAVPANRIYTAALSTLLHQVLQNMDKNVFTHVPIIKDDKMIGVFSENTLLSYLADNRETIILADATISDFKDYLPLSAHTGEHFAFLPRSAKLSDVYEIFSQAIKAHERIGMLFITEHGKPTEKPLGIITAWDLASPEFDLR